MFSAHPKFLPNFRIKLLLCVLVGMSIGIFLILLILPQNNLSEYSTTKILEIIVDDRESVAKNIVTETIALFLFLLGIITSCESFKEVML
jgi:hypothetical protein